MMIELYQGDCLEILRDNTSLLERANLILADPPYGCLNKKATWDNIIDVEEMWGLINDNTMFNVPTILFCQEPYSSQVISANIKNFKYKYYWQKTQSVGFLNAKKQPLRNIEEIAVFYRKQPTYNPQMWNAGYMAHGATKRVDVVNKTQVYGDVTNDYTYTPSMYRYPTQLLTYKSEKQTSSLHPTQKPVALLENLIKTFTNEGDTVLDFCMGSGSCGVACKNLNRNFIGIELDENYYKIAKERISK